MSKVLYLNRSAAAPLKEGQARDATVFGADLPGRRVALVPKADADKLNRALREARRALYAAEHDDGRAVFDEGASLFAQIGDALAGYEEATE